MASEFLGLRMVVTVRNGERLCGSISGVAAGQSLTLSDVWSLDKDGWQPRVIIEPADIVEIIDANKVPSALALPSQPPPSAQAFADPAILAFKPRPGPPELHTGHGPESQAEPRTGGKGFPEPTQGAVPSVRVDDLSRERTPTLKAPGSVQCSAADWRTYADTPRSPYAGSTKPPVHADHSPEAEGAQKKKRRQRQPRQQAGNGLGDEHAEASPAGQLKPAGRGKGWRETPMLQSTSSFQPFDSLKRGSRGRPHTNQDNGWASEDVTDVQEMGDFDFEGGLAKFDKRTLFDQMRKEDQVDEADRLVSHNRLPRPKPGTAGGKNLHHSENVLDILPPAPPKVAVPRDGQAVAPDFWNSEADDGVANGGERLSGREHGSRQSSRRGESKKRMPQSRKTSATAGVQGPPARSNSGVSAHPHQLRSRSSVAAERVDERQPKQLSAAASASAQGFYLLPSNRRLETVSALQMLNLENIAHNELGLTEDMMTENAGRGIAEVALTALSDPAIKLRTGTGDQSASSSGAPTNGPPPTVVVLAGNNKSGIRAVAGGRHLRNKGITVLLCVVGVERGERELLEDMRQQVRLFRNFGGHVYAKGELFEHLRKVSIPTLTIDTPRSAVTAKPPAVTLIIDALLGLAISFEELRTGDQATVYELIEWANRNEAFVLAVDVPTGIDPSSGKASIVDGSRLYVRPRYVVAMGAPKRGLLEAMSAVEADDTASAAATAPDDSVIDWKLFVADVGLGAAVWKKAGTKIRRGIDFDDKWVLEMKYRGTTIDDEELG